MFIFCISVAILTAMVIGLCVLRTHRRRRGQIIQMHSAPVRQVHRQTHIISPVIVTTTTHQAVPGGGPYQVTSQSVMSSANAQHLPYPNQQISQPATFVAFPMPQPQHQQGFQPMPQPQGAYNPYPVVHNTAPYPMGPSGPTEHMNPPPSYDQVVTAEPYQKQAPYNPNYTGH